MTKKDPDAAYREIFLKPIRKCATYRPVFGQSNSRGLSIAEFQKLYGGDSFYSWLGLDDPLVYAAHKAAGGLTSVYRQIGVGTERLFREILKDSMNLSYDQLKWSYEYDKPDGKKAVHTLDARIKASDLAKAHNKEFNHWLKAVKEQVKSGSSGKVQADGVVFEVRQGYKSADSKRQNADLRFGVRAYQAGLLPAFAIMSSQVSTSVMSRYRGTGMLVLTGVPDNDPTVSTFAFFKLIVKYDLAKFFERNGKVIRTDIKTVIEKLLSA